MRAAAFVLSFCMGCSQIFGLEPPTHGAGPLDGAVPDTRSDASSAPCAMDTFSAPTLDSMWMTVGSGAVVMQDQLVVVPPASKMGNFGITRRTGLALVGGSVEVEAAQVAAFGAAQYTYFIVGITTGNTLAIAAVNDMLQASTTVDGVVTTDSIPWSASYRYWRISFDGTGTRVTYATRADPTMPWSTFAMQDTTAPTTAGVGMGVGESTNANPSPGEARFDNFVAYCSN
jgi:hypothetical protein